MDMDTERELYTIFTDHPNSHVNESGEPVIPADALVDVFRAFGDISNVPLLSTDETDMLKTLLANNPGLEVTPTILLQFIAEKTRHSPSPSPDLNDPDDSDPPRGRGQERILDSPEHRHRSSSNESNGASYYTGSRPSSRGPQTPYGRSVFDLERRQRSTPLNNAPSSWGNKRPAPASRRRSIDGNRSDSEFSISPSAFSRSTSGHMRTHTPSNPTSPATSHADLSFSPIGSPTFSPPFPRPHSRAHSFGMFGSPHSGGNIDDNSIDDENTINNALLNTSDESSFGNAISSLPMPSSALDSDSDDEQDSSLGLVLDRNIASSTASMEPFERLDALQRTNADLGRKLMEAERTLQNRLAEHESELEEMQSKLEEMRSELSATKREEKELRSKERQNTTQISALELEVSKITKALEHAKSTYTSLQRQYQEQCSASEKYRSDLRAREELIRTLREASSLHEVEASKWFKEQQSYEERIAMLEEELSVAQGVYAQLDEQKQENLLLKETIDRMRFEMDEMRAINPNAPGGSGSASVAGTISKSLGAELMDKLKDDEGEEEEEDVTTTEEGRSMDTERSEGDDSTTAVEMDEDDESDEDVIHTIITRKKRKVASRATEFPNPSSRNHTFTELQHEDLKEYSDIAIQYDPTLICVSSGVQTLPPPITPTASFAIQTDPPPTTHTYAIQTDSPPQSPKKVTMEIEIQTDDNLEGIGTGIETPTPGEESLASSSSTILPPTPKARSLSLGLVEDDPPTYNQVAAQRLEEEKERKRVNEVLSRWHLGAKLKGLLVPLDHHRRTDEKRRAVEEIDSESESDNVDVDVDMEGIEGGIAEDLVEEWKAMKAELGVECGVIDKVLENSTKIPRNATTTPTDPTSSTVDKGKRRSGRFFNIYNTYVYGSSSSSSSSSSDTSPPSSNPNNKGIGTTLTNLATQTLIFASASVVVFVALTPYIPYLLSSTSSTIPGGATMYDRAAWASFNTLGGGAGEGIAFTTTAQQGGGGFFGSWVMGPGVDVGGDGVGGGGGTTEAVWRVLESVGGGAARMARGWPT